MSVSAANYTAESKSAIAETKIAQEIKAYDLAKLDLTKLLHDLASIIAEKEMNQILDNTEISSTAKTLALQHFFSLWWKCVQYTDMNHMHAPQHPLNQKIMMSATTVATQLKVLPLSLIAPTIRFTPALTAVTGTDLEQLKLESIVLDDKGESIIEVAPCLKWLDADIERFSIEQLDTQSRGHLCHTVMTSLQRRQLSASEAQRVINHSTAVREYYDAMIGMLDYRKVSKSLGSKIDYLITQLRKGGQAGGNGGTATFPGINAVVAIGHFNQFLASMTLTSRNKLFALKAAAGPTLTFGDRWTNLIEDKDVCIEQTADAFQAIVIKFPNLYDAEPFGDEEKESKEVKAVVESIGLALTTKYQQTKQKFTAVFDSKEYQVTASYGEAGRKKLAENLYTYYFSSLPACINSYPLLFAIVAGLNRELGKNLLHYGIPAEKLRAITPTLRDMAALINLLVAQNEKPSAEDALLFMSDQNWLRQALQNADDLYIAMTFNPINPQFIGKENLSALIQRKSKFDYFTQVLPLTLKAGFFDFAMQWEIAEWEKIIISRANPCVAFAAILNQFETYEQQVDFLVRFDGYWFHQLIFAGDFENVKINMSLLGPRMSQFFLARFPDHCWKQFVNDYDFLCKILNLPAITCIESNFFLRALDSLNPIDQRKFISAVSTVLKRNTWALLELFPLQQRKLHWQKWLQEGYFSNDRIAAHLNDLLALFPENEHNEIINVIFSNQCLDEMIVGIEDRLTFTDDSRRAACKKWLALALSKLSHQQQLQLIDQLIKRPLIAGTESFFCRVFSANICITAFLEINHGTHDPLTIAGIEAIRAASENAPAMDIQHRDYNEINKYIDFQLQTISAIVSPNKAENYHRYSKALDNLPMNARKIRGKAMIFGGLLVLTAAIPLVAYCAVAAITALAFGFIVTTAGILLSFPTIDESPALTNLRYTSQRFFNSLIDRATDKKPDFITSWTGSPKPA